MKTLEEKFKDELCLLKEWKKVEKEEYEKWIQNYENTYQTELVSHSIHFCSPLRQMNTMLLITLKKYLSL